MPNASSSASSSYNAIAPGLSNITNLSTMLCLHKTHRVYLHFRARYSDGESESAAIVTSYLLLLSTHLAQSAGVAWLSYTICTEPRVSNRKVNTCANHKCHRVRLVAWILLFPRAALSFHLAMTSPGAAPFSTVNTAARGPHYYYLTDPCMPCLGIL